ncbi:MAG: o-succinylbenzoate synthase [Ignavibacteriales bacterium]|nr:o-succinylbenzoate synthase [Ignavibacteriales bacterium]
MKIDRIVLTHVRVPLVEPFRISSGEVTAKDGIIVAIESDGLTGYGEASPMAGSFYSSDTPESVWNDLAIALVPSVLRNPPTLVAELQEILNRAGGSPFARAGIETPFWDLEGQRMGKPLWELLGGRNSPVESGLAVGIYPTIDRMLGVIDRCMREGYRRIKIKIQPGWDLVPLEAVRSRFPDIPLMVDANCAYTQKDVPHLKHLDRFGLTMIEQPLPKNDLEGHAKLQKEIQTPVCLDESADDIQSIQQAIRFGACRIVNIKIQRVGGLANAKAIHDLCQANNIPVWAGTMPELGIGGVQTLHLATLENFRFPTDVESSSRWFTEDIVEPPLQVTNGLLRVAPGPGNGHRVNAEAIRRWTIREAEFTAG